MTTEEAKAKLIDIAEVSADDPDHILDSDTVAWRRTVRDAIDVLIAAASDDRRSSAPNSDRIKAVVIEWLGLSYDAEGHMGLSNPDYFQECHVDELVSKLSGLIDAPATESEHQPRRPGQPALPATSS